MWPVGDLPLSVTLAMFFLLPRAMIGKRKTRNRSDNHACLDNKSLFSSAHHYKMSLGDLCDCGMFGLSHFTNHASSMSCSHSLSLGNSTRPRATLIDGSFSCIIENGSMASFGMCFPDDDNDLPSSLAHMKWASYSSIVHSVGP